MLVFFICCFFLYIFGMFFTYIYLNLFACRYKKIWCVYDSWRWAIQHQSKCNKMFIFFINDYTSKSQVLVSTTKYIEQSLIYVQCIYIYIYMSLESMYIFFTWCTPRLWNSESNLQLKRSNLKTAPNFNYLFLFFVDREGLIHIWNMFK